ncbi:MAG TPA: cytochrome c peroxidase [Steroidobacteraceae bacterium]|nr:cytochrome c peroxidase [Steroidobacteraceae bacterium]
MSKRRHAFSSSWPLCIIAALGMGSCSTKMPPLPAVEFTPAEREQLLTLSPLPPPPRDTTNAVDTMPAAVALGAALFFDKRLSGSGRFSCATCHDPAKAWTDGASLPQAESTGLRNTPTLWNAAYQRWLFWDGRADSLWSQALGPIEDPLEMNSTRLQVAHAIAGDASLTALYENVFGERPELGDSQRFPATGGPRSQQVDAQMNWWQLPSSDRERVNRIFVNVGKAIAAFVGTIVTKEAPFDRFVADLRAGRLSSTALPPSAQRGLKLFIGRGNCVLCHSGPNFTNLEFHDIRVPPLNSQMQPDLGRSEGIAKLATDEFVTAGYFSDDPTGIRAQHLAYLDAEAGVRGHFKTPSLRNVALTAPYMHQGQMASLREVVEHDSTLATAVEPADPNHVEALLVKLNLTEREIGDLIAFLHSLSSDQ